MKRKAFLLLAMLLGSGVASAQHVLVKGNVYGGGELGKVTLNASVTINNGTMEGSVFGGGLGDVEADTAGWVKGNTTVSMTGGVVERSIYGGGELGSVGTFTGRYTTATNGHVVGEPTGCAANTGLAKVLLSGGSVGLRGSLMPIEDHDPDDDDRGWIFCGGCGERDSLTYPKANLLAIVDTTYLEISGGVVTASVYGGCENGLVLGNTRVRITGGQIGTGYKGKINGVHTWDDVYSEQEWNRAIDSIRKGSFDDTYTIANNPFHECHAWPYGFDHDDDPNTPLVYYVYDIYAEEEANDPLLQGSDTLGSDGHSFFGNVFGGGSGYYPFYDSVNEKACWRRSAGRVWGDTHVEIVGGHILTSVYGGNEVTDVMGKCYVSMSGGTLGVPRTIEQIKAHPVTCYLFGAGMGDERLYFNTWTNVNEAEVNITGGTIFGSVFGGGEDGHVLNDVEVNIGQEEGKTTTIGTLGYSYVDGNIFGGGRGFSGNALTAGSVGGNIELNISGGLMLGSIYGGGRLASVGTYFVPPTSPNYGHLQPGPDHGYITVNITGGIIGNDYEAIEHPADHTKGGNVFGACMGRVELLDGVTENPIWPRLACIKQSKVNITGTDTIAIKGNVYGGPEFGHVHDSTIVVLNNQKARVHKIFGGGYGSTDITHHTNDSTQALGPTLAVPAHLAGRVMGNTLVKVEKGLVERTVYGGGELASVGLKKNDTFIGGKTNVHIKGGSIGNNTMYVEDDGRYLDDTHTDHDGHVFGAGQGVENDTLEVYKLYCNVNHTKVTVEGGKIYGSVFGGGAESHVLGNDTIYIHRGAEIGSVGTTSWDGNVFGGGKGNGYDLITGEGDEADTNFVAFKSCGRVEGNSYIEMDGGILYSSIFGGGRLGMMGVDVNGDYNNDNTKGLAVIKVSGETGTVPSTLDPDVDSTVYYTSIGITDGYHLLKSDESVGDIFGSGKGDTENYEDIWAGRVTNTEITITGNPRIYGAVFGGGEMASIGYWDNTGKFKSGTGSATVTIGRLENNNPTADNPIIGTDYEFTVGAAANPGQWTVYETIDGVTKIAHTATGNVFGGCQGDVDKDSPHWVSMGRSRTATVNIYGGTIKGDVYGGCEMGVVTGNATVDMRGGTIGWGIDSQGDHRLLASDGSKYSYGSLYGGGYGTTIMDKHETDSAQMTVGLHYAGRTYGDVEVSVSGGQVYGNIFGGGNLASVGWVDDNNLLKKGHCKVTVSGSAIVGPMDGTGLNGYVYGAGKGYGEDPTGQFNPYCNVNSTEVICSLNETGSVGRVYGSLYGGGSEGHVLDSTYVELNSGIIGFFDASANSITDYGGNIFGGGRNFNQKCYAAGRVGGNTHVVMNGGTLYGSVFGGGRMGMTGVDVDGMTMQEGDKHGNTFVKIKGGTVGYRDIMESYTARTIGDVYGGGKGDMRGILTPGHPRASALLLSIVKNTNVEISEVDHDNHPTHIYGCVFGGGEVANVGHYDWEWVDDPDFDELHPTPDHPADTTIGNIALRTGTGIATVTVKGGIIGADRMKMRYELAPDTDPDPNVHNYNFAYHDDVGHVFGGGEGLADNPNDYATVNPPRDQAHTDIHSNKSLLDLMASVGETHVTITKDGNKAAWVKGSVYGGSMSGHVLRDTEVTVSGGQIGAGNDIPHNADSLYKEARFFNPLNYANFTGDIRPTDTLAECVHWKYDEGTRRPFDPIELKKDYIAHGNYNESKPTDGQTWFGCVFGGGSGYYPYIGRTQADDADSAIWNHETGKVYGNTRVNITDGHILTGVYGGSEISDVGTYTYVSTTPNKDTVIYVSGGQSVITMSGGTVGVPRMINAIEKHPIYCNIYGAGKGNPYSSFDCINNVNTTSVTVKDGAIVYGSVFGGAENGHVMSDANVIINQSEDASEEPVIGTTGFSGYDGLVFGSGRGNAHKFIGDTIANFAAGRVGGNATVTMSHGNVLGNLYGGGFVARTGVGVDGSFDAFVDGTEYLSTDHGLAKVALSGGTIGNPAKKENNTGWYLLMSDEKAGNVYGGGRGDPEEHIEDDLGRSANSSVVITNSPTIYGSVFGGGQMANAGHWLGYADQYATGTSATNVNISGSPTIGTALEFSYNYSTGTGVNEPKYTEYDTINGMRLMAHTRTGNVFGGGQGDVRLKRNASGAIIGTGHPEGLEQGHCGGTTVTISGTSNVKPTIRGSVFGGAEQGAVWGDTEVNISGGIIGTKDIYYDSLTFANNTWSSMHDSTYNYGSVYGGSYGMDAFKHLGMSKPTNDDQRKAIDSVNFLAGHVYGNSTVSITGGTIYGSVYGGGDMACTGSYDTIFVPGHDHDYAYAKDLKPVASTGKTTVTIGGSAKIGPLDWTGLNAYVYGGGKGYTKDPDELRKSYANVNNTEVIISGSGITGGTIDGSVFGGGSDGHVLGNTEVKVHSGANIGTNGLTTWDGNIFGGGRDFLNTNHTNGRVRGNVTITMDGGTIQGSIFGGGRMALTGVDIDANPYVTGNVYDSLVDDIPTHGLVTINVSGTSSTSNGTTTYTTNIGNPNGDELLNDSDESVGDIFGSGKGDTKNYADTLAGCVANTKINISGSPRIYGSVFGGGEMASVGYWRKVGNKQVFYDQSGTSEVTIGETSADNPVIGTDYEYTVAYSESTPPPDWTVYDTLPGGVLKLIHTCTGNVFGGSQGDVDPARPHWISMARSRRAKVVVNGGTIKSCVYGGAEQGTIAGNTSVTINGGTIGSTVTANDNSTYIFGGVFGGGYGSHRVDYNNSSIQNDSAVSAKYVAGRTYGNTRVDVLGGLVRGDVYGGANYAYIGGYGNSNPQGNVLLNIGSHEQVNENNPRDSTYLTVGPTIEGSVFGANNHAGTPYGNVEVNIIHTKHTAENYVPEKPADGWTHDSIMANTNGTHTYHFAQQYALKEVFGGGNHASYTPNLTRGQSPDARGATVRVWYCENTIEDLYGGGDAADIGTSDKNADVNLTVDGGRFYRIFSGGNGSTGTPANIYGWANNTINGGVINELYGGGNMAGDILHTNLVINENANSCAEFIDNTFGGTNEAPILGDVVTTLECGEGSAYEFYGGTNNANIYGNVILNVHGGVTTNLFGGSKGSSSKAANIKKFPDELPAQSAWGEPGSEMYQVYQYMYDNLHATTPVDLRGKGGNVTVNLYGGTITNVFGGSNINGNIEGNIWVNVIDEEGPCPLDITNLYGGCNETDYEPVGHTASTPVTSPVVNVVHISKRTSTTPPTPGYIRHNVFGGSEGSSSDIVANPVVNFGYNAATMADYIPNGYKTTFIPNHTLHAAVAGNVYGGGEEGLVDGSTTVNVFDGEIGRVGYIKKHNNSTTVLDSIIHLEYDTDLVGGMVFGGGKGSTTLGQEDYGRVKGNSTVNISGGHVQYSVYGGGEMASVGQHTPVYQTPGDDTTPLVDLAPVANTGLATVNITGGQVGPAPIKKNSVSSDNDTIVSCGLNGLDGYVYGGGKGMGDDPISLDPSSYHPYGAYYQFANVNNTLVTVDIPMPTAEHPVDTTTNRIWGSIFGGAEDGHVLGSDTVRFKSGYLGTNGTTSYDGNIFGGGRNYAHENYTAGRVAGNTTVEMTGGQLFGNIYGGGRLALTGAGLHGMIPATDPELGDDYYQAVQDGDHGNTKVMVKGGTIGNNTVLSTGDLLIETFSEHSMGSVYGGGMGTLDGIDVPGHPKASSLLFGMTKNTVVEISEADHDNNPTHIYGIVFGGGEIANVGKFTWHQNLTTLAISDIDVTEGKAKVTISGGTIGADKAKMRWEPGTGDYVMYPLYNDDLGYVYGGGEGYSDDPLKEENGVRVYPDVNTARFGTMPLLDLMSSVHETEVEISGTAWVKASVFGGSESGHVMSDTKVTISGGQIGAGHNDVNPDDDPEDKFYASGFIDPTTTAIPDNMYGTYHWEYSGDYDPYDPAEIANHPNTYKPTDGKSWFGNVFGGGSGWFPYITNEGTELAPNYVSHWNPNSGKVWGNTEVNIEGGHILNNVYGANESTNVEGKATVKMSAGTVGVPLSATRYAERPLLGYIYGGGAGDERTIFNSLTNVDSTNVQITGGIIYGSVMGGSEDGHILGDTKITVSGSTTVIGSTGKSGYDGNIFGGGRNFFGFNENSGYVGGETTIKMSNGVALGNVYGGGRNGSVVKSSHVNISGGEVGTEQIGVTQATIVNGNVFGGGLGKAGGKLQGNAHKFANVDSTYVNISGSAMIYNTVFGGGDNGHVKKSTVVKMTGGTVGQKNTMAEFVTDSLDHKSTNIYTGNVLGGGRGISVVSPGVYNDTTGIVFGNTNVTIEDGTVRHAVYGGGGLAHVGTFVEKSSDTIRFASGTGITKVTVTGGIIGPTKLDLTDGYNAEQIKNNFKYIGGNAGWVFGAGCGLPGQSELTFNDSTFVTIGGTAEVVGAVFGGGENGHVARNTRVDITGGTIGAYPLQDQGTVNITEGVYSGVSFTADKAETYENKYGGGHRVFRGDVYGGGKGTDTIWVKVGNEFVPEYSHTAGRVYGNTTVNVSGGKIYQRVYGGGSLASVGKYTYHKTFPTTNISLTDSIQRVSYKKGTGATNVKVNGGTIGNDGLNNGDVVGGGRGVVGNTHGYDVIISGEDGADQVARMAYVGSTNVKIESGANIRSNVYGGSLNGHVYGDTKVVMDGGTVGYSYMDTDTLKVHGAWHSNLYGGGGGSGRFNKGNKPHLSITSGRVFGNTNVTITGGQVYHNVYGGGAIASVGTYDLRANHEPEVDGTGTATVTITGGTIGLDSFDQGLYNQGKFGNDGNNNGMVFGSGRGEIDSIGAYSDSLSFVIRSIVNIGKDGETGPKVKGSVYGSGENGHVYKRATVNVYSGTIGCNYDEYATYAAAPTTYAKQLNQFPYRGNVYGAGCGTDKFTDKHGVKKYNPQSGIVWGDAELNVSGGYISRNVYGGGAMASVGYYTSRERHGADGDTLSWPCEFTYLLESSYPTTGVSTVNITGGHIGTVALANNPTASGCVYGSSRGEAGKRYEMVPFSNVKQAYVNVYFTPLVTSFEDVTDDTKDVIIGSVFGSGESGHVYDTTSVTITDGLIAGSVFGGGDGTAMYLDSLWIVDPEASSGHSTVSDTLVHSITAGKVFGNTCVTVRNGYILHNVYGGGNMASVGKGNYNGEKRPEHDDKDYGESGNFNLTTTKSGRTHVRIYGGQIGTDGNENGHVFGSSRGLVFPSINLSPRYNYSRDFFLGYTNKSYVTIGENVVANPNLNSPRIYGSVFGGGQDGHVRLNTQVIINDAEIGVAYGEGSLTLEQREYVGNVYGAGRGIDMYDSDGNGTLDKYCPSSGSVTRNTHVIVNGGQIYNDVYGGGSLATLGPPAPPYYDPSHTIVDIKGGTIGTQNGVENKYGGDVFGSSRGKIAEPGNDLDNMATVVSARVNIGESGASSGPTIYASVYGGGDNGHVKTSDTVYVYSGTIGIENPDPDLVDYCGNVFGGGSGLDTYLNSNNIPTHNPNAGKVSGHAYVFIDGDHATVNGSVFGGGNTSNVLQERVVTINKGMVKGNVYGGGNTGIADDVPFTSLKTVNVRGGHICGHVFGSSNDAKEKHPDVPSSPWPSNDKNNYWSSFVNITGGQIDNNVYAAGYGGDVDGSVCVNIGLTAVKKAPTYTTQSGSASDQVNTFYNVGLGTNVDPTPDKLSIGGNVFGGAFKLESNTGDNWDYTYDITGYSRIFIDGEGYKTGTTGSNPDMNIVGGIYGSGNYCESGAKGQSIVLRNYGERILDDTEGHTNDMADATRTLTTLQRASTVFIDNSNVHFSGAADISQWESARVFAILNVNDSLYVANASGIVLGAEGAAAHIDSIGGIMSLHLKGGVEETVYKHMKVKGDANWEWIGVNPYGEGGNTPANARLWYSSTHTAPLTLAQENVIIFNADSRLWVRYWDKNAKNSEDKTMYGPLIGFFRMKADHFAPVGTTSFAYARPKLTSKVNPVVDGSHSTDENTWNYGDGGFLSYNTAYNFFVDKTNYPTVLGFDYPTDGDDGGLAYTNTKQYPYYNITVASNSKDNTDIDMKHYREWVLRTISGQYWYVDGRGIGRGGWGKDENHQNHWGHKPDMPKLTITGLNGIFNDHTYNNSFNEHVYENFDPKNDIIFVVGPVKASEEANKYLNLTMLEESPDKHYPLMLFRYPGGHQMSNATPDEGGKTAPENYDAYNGIGTDGVTNGPGFNSIEMIRVNQDLVLDNVMVNGLSVYNSSDSTQLNLPASGSYHVNRKKVTEPMVVTDGEVTLALKGGTTLERGYNSTNADVWYTDSDYTPGTGVHHGGALYVDEKAFVNVEGVVFINEENKQRLKIGSATEKDITCNVYLPTFDKALTITGALNERTEIGITSPKRNTAKLYLNNTFSPVATADAANIASHACANDNFTDDQEWFFTREHRSTYYCGDDGIIQELVNNKTLYFGWTWANVVRKAPVATSIPGSNDFSYSNIDHPEDLAWLISLNTGMNGATATNFHDINITQTADLDMKQYVWVPIGQPGVDKTHKSFRGVYDGQGHLIDSIFVEYIGKGDNRYHRSNYGLFGKVSNGGKVTRTFVVGGKIRPEGVPDERDDHYYHIGGLVGLMDSTAVVANSEAAVKIDCPRYENARDVIAGGLVGLMQNGKIHSSMAMSEIAMGKLTKGYAGGLVGKSEAGDIYNSFVNAKLGVLLDDPDNKKVGGLLGANQGATVKNCYVTLHGTSLPEGTLFDGIVYDKLGGTVNMVYLQSDYNSTLIGEGEDDCKKFAPVISADNLGYQYYDNRIDGDTTLVARLNMNAYHLNGLEKPTAPSIDSVYAHWARPGIPEINGDLPVLLLSEFDDPSGKAYQGGFRSVGTYAGGPALQYGGPARDGSTDEVSSALSRSLEYEKDNEHNVYVAIPDYLFIYGDVASSTAITLPTGKSITQSKVSVYENVSILHPGALGVSTSGTDYADTYVGISFDNSCGHAIATPGVNYGIQGSGGDLLPRDWHMFSTPLVNAPQGFYYQNTNAAVSGYTDFDNVSYSANGHYNNPWFSSNEFGWLTSAGSTECASGASFRYWMNDEDGYFPKSRGTLFNDNVSSLFIVGSDECPASGAHRYPYGMDFYTWTEPDYHWINFKRNGPNHWHTDGDDHLHINYQAKPDADANVNETTLVPAKGYLGAITKPTFMQSHGTLNSGNQSITLTKSGAHLKGWNLVGNPYHGYIDFNSFATNGDNANLLVKNGSNQAFYVVYDADSIQDGVPGTGFLYYPDKGSAGGHYAGRYIHPHQGFYVKMADAATTSTLKFTESMLKTRSDINESHFRDEMPNYPLVNLFLSSDNGCRDVTVIEFDRPEWGGATKLKELRIGNGIFYGHHGDDDYAAMFVEKGTPRVPLWFEAKEDDIYTMTWKTANGNFHSMYLIDNLTGIQYDMLRNDTYQFEGHKGDYWSRFYIVFDVTDVDENGNDGFVFFDGSQWVVTGDGELEVIDVLGHILQRTNVEGQARISLNNVAEGLYLMRLTNGKQCRMQKVVVTR